MFIKNKRFFYYVYFCLTSIKTDFYYLETVTRITLCHYSFNCILNIPCRRVVRVILATGGTFSTPAPKEAILYVANDE